MTKKVIPIVMASNDKYVPYLGVAISSMIECFSSEKKYELFILETDMSATHKKRIKKLEIENVKIDFYDVSKWIERFDIPTVNHLTPEATYRLLVDKIFKEYTKIIYIDCDVVVRRDLGELYEIELGSNMLGAVRGRVFPASAKYINDELKLPIDIYFNSGVLLINLKRFREENIGDKGLKMLSEKTYSTQDQDVLNILCKNHVKYIDGRWNVEWEHLTGLSGQPIIDESRKGSLDLVNDPYIVHYTTGIKPWTHPEIELAELFWKIARKTIFYEEILFNNLEKKYLFSMYIFPWRVVNPNARIVLYGYGNVGRILYEQLMRTKYVRVMAVCDKRAESILGLNVPVILPSALVDSSFDYIVIAVEQEQVANNIKRELLDIGIDANVIRWGNPLINYT